MFRSQTTAPLCPFLTGGEAALCAHTAQFYSDGVFFLDELSRYIGTALISGDAAVVIATEAHRITDVEYRETCSLTFRRLEQGQALA